RAVFVLQRTPALLAPPRTGGLLRRIDELFRAPAEALPAPVPRRDPLWAYVRRFPRSRRRAAMERVARWRQALRGGTFQLGREVHGQDGPVALALATRRIDAA